MIKVVLLQDIKGVGKKGDILNVSDGYAVNYLFKKKLAKRATRNDIKRFEEVKRYDSQIKHQAEQIFNNLDDLLRSRKFVIYRKASSGGNLYDDVDPSELIAYLKEQVKELIAFDKVVVKDNVRIKRTGRHVIELEIGFKGDKKVVPIVVDVVPAGAPKLKSATLETNKR